MPLKKTLVLIAIIISVIVSVYTSQLFGAHKTLNVSVETYSRHTQTAGDQEAYMAMAQGQEASSPYRYRIAPVLPVSALIAIGVNTYDAFMFVNVVFLIASAYLMALLVTRFYRATFTESVLCALLVIMSTGVSRTIFLPMLDIGALFASVLVLYAILDGRLRVFIPVIIFAIATKEVFAIAGLTYALFHKDAPQTLRLAMLMLPVILFSGLRIALGGSALEVNYGYDLGNGELPLQYLDSLFNLGEIKNLPSETMLAGGLLWVGLVSAIFDRFTRITLFTYVLPMVIASWVLSARYARPLVVIVPVLVIGTLELMRYISKK